MQRMRDVLADVFVGAVVMVVAFWLLRGVFRVVYWGASTVLIVLALGFVFRVASKLRG